MMTTYRSYLCTRPRTASRKTRRCQQNNHWTTRPHHTPGTTMDPLCWPLMGKDCRRTNFVLLQSFPATQRTDKFCRQQVKLVGTPVPTYDMYRNSLLLRRSTVDDGALQKLVPVSLRPCMLSLCHDSITAGHTVSHHMYYTNRQDLYCPHMLTDIYDFVPRCISCIRNRAHITSTRSN